MFDDNGVIENTSGFLNIKEAPLWFLLQPSSLGLSSFYVWQLWCHRKHKQLSKYERSSFMVSI